MGSVFEAADTQCLRTILFRASTVHACVLSLFVGRCLPRPCCALLTWYLRSASEGNCNSLYMSAKDSFTTKKFPKSHLRKEARLGGHTVKRLSASQPLCGDACTTFRIQNCLGRHISPPVQSRQTANGVTRTGGRQKRPTYGRAVRVRLRASPLSPQFCAMTVFPMLSTKTTCSYCCPSTFPPTPFLYLEKKKSTAQ